MVNENRRYHVALVDPMPAGLEAMNPALAVTGPIPHGSERAEGARSRTGGGTAPGTSTRTCATSASRRSRRCCGKACTTYTYVARATTPGNFVVPPPKAEEMYMPETFGRGGSDRVIVE